MRSEPVAPVITGKIPTRKRTAQTPADGRALLDGDSYAAERYDRVDLTDRDLRHATFSECTFAGATLTDADLTELDRTPAAVGERYPDMSSIDS